MKNQKSLGRRSEDCATYRIGYQASSSRGSHYVRTGLSLSQATALHAQYVRESVDEGSVRYWVELEQKSDKDGGLSTS